MKCTWDQFSHLSPGDVDKGDAQRHLGWCMLPRCCQAPLCCGEGGAGCGTGGVSSWIWADPQLWWSKWLVLADDSEESSLAFQLQPMPSPCALGCSSMHEVCWRMPYWGCILTRIFAWSFCSVWAMNVAQRINAAILGCEKTCVDKIA